eukprot:g48120.t1
MDNVLPKCSPLSDVSDPISFSQYLYHSSDITSPYLSEYIRLRGRSKHNAHLQMCFTSLLNRVRHFEWLSSINSSVPLRYCVRVRCQGNEASIPLTCPPIDRLYHLSNSQWDLMAQRLFLIGDIDKSYLSEYFSVRTISSPNHMQSHTAILRLWVLGDRQSVHTLALDFRTGNEQFGVVRWLISPLEYSFRSRKGREVDIKSSYFTTSSPITKKKKVGAVGRRDMPSDDELRVADGGVIGEPCPKCQALGIYTANWLGMNLCSLCEHRWPAVDITQEYVDNLAAKGDSIMPHVW